MLHKKESAEDVLDPLRIEREMAQLKGCLLLLMVFMYDVIWRYLQLYLEVSRLVDIQNRILILTGGALSQIGAIERLIEKLHGIL